MEFAALEAVGFKEKMKRSNSYNPKIEKLPLEQKILQLDERKGNSQINAKQEKSSFKENKSRG